MTAQTPTYLKGRFEQGDIPQGSDYEDLIDSFVNLQTSAIQTMVGGLVSTNFIYGAEINGALVSAASGIFSFVSAQTAQINNLNATIVSATTVSANAIHVSTKLSNGYTEALPRGLTQTSATSADFDVTKITVSAGGVQERGIRLSEHHAGRVQYLVNDAASVTAASIYPSFGCNFLATATNAPLLLAASQTIQIIHVNASAYAFIRY